MTYARRELAPPRFGWAAVIMLVLALLAARHLGLQFGELTRGWENLIRLSEDAFPPQTALLPTAGVALLETLAIALLGTVVGFMGALPMGILATRTLFPGWVVIPTRLIAASVRTLPSLLWAVLFVILVGFGPLAGVLAMAFYTMGHLAKLQYESLEGLPPEPIEALRATGASRIQVARYVALPEASNQILSQLLYMFEYNIRASSIMGFVGAGGIGYYISRYLQMMQYDGVVALLLVVFVAIVAVDWLSLQLRSRFLTKVPGAA